MKLSKKALDCINNMSARMRMGIILEKSETTIKRYIAENDIMLTTSLAIDFIKNEFALTESEIFETETAVI